MTTMRPLEVKSSMCAVSLCCESPFKGPLCYRHSWYQALGKFLMTIATVLALFLAFAALMTLSGCGAAPKKSPSIAEPGCRASLGSDLICNSDATDGLSKARLRELLAQCRRANRERVKIIKAYDAQAADCNKETCSEPDASGVRFCSRTAMYCPRAPAQDFGTINFGEAGN